MLKLRAFSSLSILALCVLLSACSIKYHYTQALNAAAQPSASKISSNLTVVAATTPSLQWKKINGEDYVLVSSWKADT
ncbi:MAG TPA: hypothetical protein PLC89_29310, partial [Haliscomenobacter sp.]